jgi:hypothetical protein
MIRLDLDPCLRSSPPGNCIFSILSKTVKPARGVLRHFRPP